jgi:predicted nucleotidyltransferase
MVASREAQILDAIKSALLDEKEALAEHRVLLFGSRAAGTARSRSDFDIGIEGKTPLDVSAMSRIIDRLDAIETLYRIDCVDLQSVSEHFRENALHTAKVIYE